MATVLKNGLIAGVILFAWGMISWMALPWHKTTMMKFGNETIVQQALQWNTQAAGVYILPNSCQIPKNTPADKQKEMKQKAMQQMEKGPFVVAVVQPNGIGSMKKLMIQGFAIQLIGAFLASWLLLQAKIKSFGGKLMFVGVFALAAAVFGYLPYWNWFGFPTFYTLLDCADLLIGWLLAGTAIAVLSKN